MASSVTPLRLLELPQDDGALDRLSAWVMERVPNDGHMGTTSPDLCLYRFSHATTFLKMAAFGVTLGVVLQGEKRINVGGDEILVDRSHLLVMTREIEHLTVARTGSPGRPYLSLALCFTPEQVARALMTLTEAGGEPVVEETSPLFVMPYDREIGAALERLLGTMNDPMDRKVLAPLIVDEILYRLLRSESAAAVRSGFARTGDAVRILETMRYMRQNLSQKLSVEDLARLAAMSPSHFAHRFSAVARMAPMKFLREVRLERARTLLLSNGTRASEVAAEVGFESAAHFTREFKRRFGAPPSTYLRPKARGGG